MEKTTKHRGVNKEFLGALWCALNCATTLESRMELMDLIQGKSHGHTRDKWQAYVKFKKSTFEAAMADLKKLI